MPDYWILHGYYSKRYPVLDIRVICGEGKTIFFKLSCRFAAKAAKYGPLQGFLGGGGGGGGGKNLTRFHLSWSDFELSRHTQPSGNETFTEMNHSVVMHATTLHVSLNTSKLRLNCTCAGVCCRCCSWMPGQILWKEEVEKLLRSRDLEKPWCYCMI